MFDIMFSYKCCVGNCQLSKAMLLNPFGAHGTLKKLQNLLRYPNLFTVS